MTVTTRNVVDEFRALLTGPAGVDASAAKLAYHYGLDDAARQNVEVFVACVPPDMFDKAAAHRYPALHVYCSRIERNGKEKFNRMSGSVELVTEIRVSADRVERCWDELHLYVDAVRDVVESHRGCLADGLYLDGDYVVEIGLVKKGGLNFLQIARLTCVVLVTKE